MRQQSRTRNRTPQEIYHQQPKRPGTPTGLRFALLRLSMAAVLLSGLASCGSNPQTATRSTPPSSPSPTPTIASPGSPSPGATPGALNPNSPKPEFTTVLESKLRTVVAEAIRVPVDSINCPAKAEAKVGDRFDCQAVAAGQTFAVSVALTDQTGQFKWNTKELILLPKLETFIQTRLQEKEGLAVTANCGGKLRVAKPGNSFDCKLTDTQGQSRSAKVTVKDEQGSVDISLLPGP